ncbi:unnamed protein product [Camellia sinensis]
MKGGTVQINWHDTKPVLTLDFHPTSGILATGGADFDIKIRMSCNKYTSYFPGLIMIALNCNVQLWLINPGEIQKKTPTASYQNSLAFHGSAVNAIRFSPSGEYLASGADAGHMEITLYRCRSNMESSEDIIDMFHRKDVLDLQWSTDGAFLVSGSVDNSCIIWDVNKGSVLQILDAHLHYVQGVAWDPLAKYVASLSSDRTCRIYVNKPQSKEKGNEKRNYVCQHVIAKSEHQMIDELAWSPDGSFLLVPAGSYRFSPASEPVNTSYVFSRKDLTRPALVLPGASKPVVAVRVCPVAFALRTSNSDAFFKLPYRLVFAVATLNSLYIYDTESIQPISILAGLHYAAITDIAWSATGKYLALSSQDGYCTLVEFENDELGSPISLSEEGKKGMDDESKSSIEKPEDMEVEGTLNNKKVAALLVVENEGKQQSSVIIPMQNNNNNNNKPAATAAKRRITPMAID